MSEGYLTIDQVARKLRLTPQSIAEQIRLGRVETVERRGVVFLSDREVYKLKFVFYLENNRGLTAEQIDRVLRRASPPYDSWQDELVMPEDDGPEPESAKASGRSRRTDDRGMNHER